MSTAVNNAAAVKPTWKAAVKGNVLMMGLVSLFTDFSSEMMNPLLPIFIAGLVGGVKAAFYVGLMEGIAETTASLLKIYSGRMSDKLGKRKALVILGYGASSFARPLMGLAGLAAAATGGLQVVMLKFLDRVGKGIRTSPRDALIGDSVPKEVRGLAFSFHRSMDHFGAVLGPIVAIGILYVLLGSELWHTQAISVQAQKIVVQKDVGDPEMHALRWLFAIALIPGLAAIAALVFKVREVEIVRKSTEVKVGLWGSLPRNFRLFVGIVTLFALGNSSDLFIVLLAATMFHMSMLGLLILWIVFHLSKIVFSIPGGIISDKLGRRPVIVAGWIVYALVYLGFAMATKDWQFWALFLVYGFYYGMCEGAEKALVADFVPSEHRGTAFGIYHGAIGIAALPASLLFGLLWVKLDLWYGTGVGRTWAFGIGAALAAAAAGAMLWLLASYRIKPAAS